MSLREKAIEIQFADFIKKYFSYIKYPTPKNLTPRDLLRAVVHNQLYDKTIVVMEDIRKSWKPNLSSKAELIRICDLARRHFRFKKFYLFSVKQAQKEVEMIYSYPLKNKKVMVINASFVKKLADKSNRVKCAEAIKSYFQIDFPEMAFQELWKDNQDENVRLLFHLPEFINEGIESEELIYSRLLNFIFDFSSFSPKDGQPQLKSENLVKSQPSFNSSSQKIYLYQRLVSQLPLLLGEEMDQSIPFLFQIARFTRVIVCDGNMKEVYGTYSLTDSKYNQIVKAMPNDWKKEFAEAEKKHLARNVKVSSGKHLLIFLSRPLHPQKKAPEFPFPSYPDVLEKILIKHSAGLKR